MMRAGWDEEDRRRRLDAYKRDEVNFRRPGCRATPLPGPAEPPSARWAQAPACPHLGLSNDGGAIWSTSGGLAVSTQAIQSLHRMSGREYIR